MSKAAAPAIATSMLGLLLLAAPALGDVKPLSLYERAGRAPWLIYGEVSSIDKRFVVVKVVEVLKGSYQGDSLRIIYKLENFLRKSWEDRMVFTAGEHAVFFLKRYETDRPDGRLDDWMKAEDLFAEAFGAQGKFSLPEEGSSAYVDALREFVRINAIADPEARDAALLKFLESSNPHMLQAGLERILEEKLAGSEQVPLLLRLSDSARDPVRLEALQALEQIALNLAAAGRRLDNQADVINLLKGKALGEGGDLYRAEAVKVVAALAGEEERVFLERLSREDHSQLVRYEASRSLRALGSH